MICLRALGCLDLDLGNADGAASSLRPRVLALLALLLGSRAAAISRDKVVAYLWPDSDTEHARNSLKQALFTLRHCLGRAIVQSCCGGLRLDHALVACDVWEFEHDQATCGGSVAAAHLVLRAWLGVPDDILWASSHLDVELAVRHVWVALRVVIAGVAASALVVSASGPRVDIAQTLRANVVSSGWMRVATTGSFDFSPALELTLTNTGRCGIGPIELNAMFADRDPDGRSRGAAFAFGIGSEGLGPGATSRVLLLRVHSDYRDLLVRLRRPFIVPAFVPVAASARLFARYEGRWTYLAELPIPPEVLSE